MNLPYKICKSPRESRSNSISLLERAKNLLIRFTQLLLQQSWNNMTYFHVTISNFYIILFNHLIELIELQTWTMLKINSDKRLPLQKTWLYIITFSAKNTKDRSKYLPRLLFLFFTTQRMSKTKTNNKCLYQVRNI